MSMAIGRSGGVEGMRTPGLISFISCSFQENAGQIIAWRNHLRVENLGNAESATDCGCRISKTEAETYDLVLSCEWENLGGGGAPHLMLGGAVVKRNLQSLPLGDWEVKNITSEERNNLSSNVSKNFVQGILSAFYQSPLAAIRIHASPNLFVTFGYKCDCNDSAIPYAHTRSLTHEKLIR